MKIAQVSPLWESVPPKLYGGTERIVSYLTEELVRLGHDVALLASGDSVTTAKLKAATPEALRLSTGIFNRDAPMVSLLEQAFGASSTDFDVIHSHLDFIGFPIARRCATPVITTMHVIGTYTNHRTAFYPTIARHRPFQRHQRRRAVWTGRGAGQLRCRSLYDRHRRGDRSVYSNRMGRASGGITGAPCRARLDHLWYGCHDGRDCRDDSLWMDHRTGRRTHQRNGYRPGLSLDGRIGPHKRSLDGARKKGRDGVSIDRQPVLLPKFSH